MPARILLVIAPGIREEEAEFGRSGSFDLADDFDTVMGRVVPTQQPSSALEARSNATHTLIDGRRLYMRPDMIAAVEELNDSADA